ncbi:MAG: EscS/YscS/HrcS family type III secretion system export apparatus protein [Betaproteobacteria bacterium]|nr:EscS/YscS/HrcS family type III secretion system export apparatus protein [Betaproteobacteria bacterium]
MESSLIIELILTAMRMAVILAGPVLLTVLVVGIVIGALQSATQINEPSVVFVPKMLAVMLVLALTGATTLTLGLFVDYVREMITRIPAIAG